MNAGAPPPQFASAGKVHLLNLAALKERLGTKWDRISGHVHMFFDTAIKRSLGPSDSVTRTDELSYVLMFPNLTADEAEVKCTAISHEVCKRLFGESGVEASLRNLVAHMDLNAFPKGADLSGAVNDFLERYGKEVIVTANGSKTAAPPGDGRRSPAFRMGYTNDLLSRRRVATESSSFVYRPLWDSTKQIVLTYICQPVLPTSEERAGKPVSGFCNADEEEDQGVLDLLVLRQGVDRIAQLNQKGLRLLIAVPVHFATLSRPRLWQAYSAAWRAIKSDISRDLTFVVFGFEPGVPNIRLVHELPKLSLSTRLMFCAVDRGDRVGARFANTGTYAIGLALSPTDAEPVSIARMNGVAREARAEGMEAFVLGAASSSLTLSGIGAGIRYLEGAVIKPAQSDPRHAFAHDIADLYQAKIARA